MEALWQLLQQESQNWEPRCQRSPVLCTPAPCSVLLVQRDGAASSPAPEENPFDFNSSCKGLVTGGQKAWDTVLCIPLKTAKKHIYFLTDCVLAKQMLSWSLDREMLPGDRHPGEGREEAGWAEEEVELSMPN